MNADEKECPFCAETIKAAAVVCKHCGRTLTEPAAGPQPQVAPSLPLTETPKKKKGCLRLLFYGFLACVALAIVNQVIRTISPDFAREQDARTAQRERDEVAAKAERERATAQEKAAHEEAQKKERERLEAATPIPEKQLIAAVAAGYEDFKKGGNEIQQEQARDRRGNAIASALGRPEAIEWFGTIDSISTNSDGLGVLSITISSDPEVTVSTWNNALSDAFDNTLIPKNSPVYSAMAGLKEGDEVLFSGRFIESARDAIRESSMTISGSMSAPDFKMIFRSVKKIQ